MAERSRNHDSRAMLTEHEAADVLTLNVRTLQAWRVKGGGPVFIKLGGSVRYRKSDLDAFIAQGVRRPTRPKPAPACHV